MPNELSGEALDARFFEVCIGWRRDEHHEHGVILRTGPNSYIYLEDLEPVSTDANACESWAMRWAREQGMNWRIDSYNSDARVEVYRSGGGTWYAYGTDYKQAFVRACVAAGQIINKAKGGA